MQHSRLRDPCTAELVALSLVSARLCSAKVVKELPKSSHRCPFDTKSTSKALWALAAQFLSHSIRQNEGGLLTSVILKEPPSLIFEEKLYESGIYCCNTKMPWSKAKVPVR